MWYLELQGFPGGSVVKNPPANAGDTCLISGLGRSPGGGNGNPFQFSYLGNPKVRRSLEGYSPWGCKRVGYNSVTKNQQQPGVAMVVLKLHERSRDLRDPNPEQLSANSENKLQLLKLYFLLLWPKVIPALHNGLFLFLLLNYSNRCVRPGNLPLFDMQFTALWWHWVSSFSISHLQALCPNTDTHNDWQSEDRVCRVRIRGTGGK